MHKHKTMIRMAHTDAAGWMFFAAVFELAHECYETFMDEQGMSLGAMLDRGSYLAPIVHAEADFSKPMRLSESITIELSLGKIGKGSFMLSYKFVNSDGETTAKVATVHAMIDKATGRCSKMPGELAAVLGRL